MRLDDEVLDQLVDSRSYTVKVAGHTVGTALALFGRTTYLDPDSWIETQVWQTQLSMNLEIDYFGETQHTTFIENYYFDVEAPYALRFYASFSRDSYSDDPASGGSQKIELHRQDDGTFMLYVKSAKTLTESVIEDLEYTVKDHLAIQLWFRCGAGLDQSMRYTYLNTENFELQSAEITIEDSTSRIVDGRRIPVYSASESYPSEWLDIDSEYDIFGWELRSSMAGVMDLIYDPDAAAPEDTEPTESVDFSSYSVVPCNRSLGDLESVKQVQIMLHGEYLPQLSNTATQSFRQGENRIFVTLRNLSEYSLERLASVGPQASSTEVSSSLESTIEIPAAHPEIQRLAQQAIGTAEGDLNKVRNLMNFCYNYVEANYTAQPTTIWDLIKNRQGDCTESALLFVTLARAAQIPARRVTGVLYYEDEQPAFYYHEWNEVVIDGHWLGVDAAWNEFVAGPRRITYASDWSAEQRNLTAMLHRLEATVLELKTE